jgi:hypothetical protein
MDLANAFLSSINVSGPLKVSGKWATCIAYASAREVAQARASGFPSAFCRKFGKIWTVGVLIEDITSDVPRVDAPQ